MYIHLRNLIVFFFGEDDIHPFKESYRLFFIEDDIHPLRDLIVFFFFEDDVRPFNTFEMLDKTFEMLKNNLENSE